MKITLKDNSKCLVDNEDLEKLSKYSWYKHSEGYAVTNINKKYTLMHRFLLNAKRNEVVDHINGNKLDNRKSNLRLASPAQNMMNSRGRNKFKGVSKTQSKTSPWRATIKINQKSIHIGAFKTELEAAYAYDSKAREIFGQFAKTNF